MGRKNYQIISRLWLVAVLFFTACVKDKPNPTTPPVVVDTTNNVYIVCEGSLGNGNSSLGLYQTEDGQTFEDVYKSANSQAIGDVLQSIIPIGDRFFLCVNNSDKVVVINKEDHKQIGSISIPKPRYILPISANKAYVSTLFSKKLYIIDPQAMSVTKIIDMPYENAEGMLLKDGIAYVCPWDTATDKVLLMDVQTDEIKQTITVAGRAPQEIVTDKDGKLWVLSGNVYKDKDAALTCIDPNTNQVVKSHLFPHKVDPIRLVTNNAKDQLYYIEVDYNGGTANNGIYRMNISDASLPSQALIQAVKFQYFWALGVEPGTDKIYVGDPKGFIQKGSVGVYNTDGVKEKEFSTGIGPGHFYFQ
jgi:DNA-binding beta-propeller fold protein YncE